jgi:hypothetical protein
MERNSEIERWRDRGDREMERGSDGEIERKRDREKEI